MNFGREILLVVAPHPDDEILGCGGLMQKVKRDGGKVYVLFMTVGDTKEYSQNGSSTLSERLLEIEKVAKHIQYDDYAIAFKGNGYHLHLDTIPQKDIISQIEGESSVSLKYIKPTILAAPFLDDYNQDHVAATRAVFSAARPAPLDAKPFQGIILGYECVSIADWWTRQRPLTTFLPLTQNQLEEKISTLALYSSQIRIGPHARSLESIKSLAYFRGLYIGQYAAEAFYAYRWVL